MSSRWMSKVHALVPLTEQEEQVQDILLQHAISFVPHAVFPVANRLYVVDFYLPGQRVAIEVWRSVSRRGVALNWVEKNACYVDMKFRRIKRTYPEVTCLALVEVMQADPELVRGVVGGVMSNADTLCCSMEEMAEALRRATE